MSDDTTQSEAEQHGRHRRTEDVVLAPLPDDATERGEMADPYQGNPWFGGVR